MNKERVDVLLVNQGYFPTRERAKAAIMAGIVFVNEERVDKPGLKLDQNVTLRVKGEVHPFVSRGGLKLQKAIVDFKINLTDKWVLDIGASTGGFTDCALQHGAVKVVAIDVGYGQLDWKLRQDPRVVVMERTNFRYLTQEDLSEERFDIATIDVSFISLTIILQNLVNFMKPNGDVIALVKPQFEAGKEQVGKKGIVRDAKVHKDVIRKVMADAISFGYAPIQLTHSPIQGGEGNIEFLFHLRYVGGEQLIVELEESIIETIVAQAHTHFLS